MSAMSPNTISSRITNPLHEVQQRQWTVLAARGVLQTLVTSLGMLLVVSMVLGFFANLPMIPRIALAVLGWGTVIWAAIHYLRPALQRWSLSRAAQFAEQSIPDSEERISSAVELSQADKQFRGSSELVAHLVRQAEVDASRVKVGDVVPFKTVFMWMLAFLPVLAVWAILAMNSHTNRMLLRGLFSTITPWQVAPTILADVQVKPGDVTLAQGDSLDVKAIVSPNGGKLPKSANLVRTFATLQSTSESLEQVGGTEFTRNLENLQQSFKYMVHTDRGDSATYNVTVRPRPAISRLDVRYDFPKYTGLDAKSQIASDGNIDAVVGTKITLTVATTDSLVIDKSQIAFNEGQKTAANIALAATDQKNVYTATFTVAQTGEYRVKLLNEYNLGNKDDDVRAVTAEVDQAPTIAINSPKEQITVRPDDEVSVMYAAGDDYGITTIQALVQVDDKPEVTLPVKIHGTNRKTIKDQWLLSVPAMLKSAGVANGTRLSYQLKATDNRDPDPQTGLSLRQTLLIDKNEKNSFKDKLLDIQKEDLQAAIRKAIERLNQGSARVANVRDAAVRDLAPDTLKQATGLRDYLANTGKDLSVTAADYFDTPFADVAKKAKDIADTGIATSADEMARFTLDSANHDTARAHGVTSYDTAIKARDDLQKLLEEAEKAEQRAKEAEALKELAKEQAEIAKEMAEHPENNDQNLKKQQDAINKLQEQLQKDPDAQKNQQAQQLAQKLAELENKVEQQEQKQTELQNQTAKQEEQQQAEKAANALAEEQKKLNQEEQKFAKDDKKALDQANAQTPDQKQQEQLVQNIEKNQLQNAAQEAQQAADQLKQDAQKLDDQAKNANPQPNADQQKQQQQDQQNAQDAQNAQNQANQDAQDLKNQAAQPQQNADANKQDAQKTQDAAQAIAKAADKVEKANDQGAKNADVQKEADAAKADAQQAAQDAQAAAQAQNPQDAAKDEAKAAQELAQAGQELNQAAQAEAKADQAQAQKDNQAAAAQAADQAKDLAQQQQQIAQALAQQAQQQADAQQQGAQTPQQEAQAQQQAAQQAQQAQQAAQQLAQQAQAQQDPALAQRADQAAQALAEAAKDQQQAAQADAQGKPDDAAQAQADAQHELAKADQALRGNPEQAQANAEQGQPEQGQPEQGHPEQGQPEQGQPEQGQGHPEQGQGHPEQSAAQAAAEAAQAQQQALQPSPAAAAEAAQALAQAAEAAQQALPGQPEDGPPGDEQGPPENEPGMHPSTHTGPGTDPKMGISASDSGGNNKPPASVVALGISGNDWAKLPPIMQRELMNASQQSGPPAYKEMIKNYYVRVARMQNDHPTPTQKK